ncbi:hypothetical protein BN3087_660001 [Sulfurovum sp. enrichment culture clone C5]|uniref:Uncharacterized protein n=1 Tax=Sulfurovum sp. enrichment culture clone C5 TaxID=497650 RepID=A0A0S4XPE2_9BACT|nr:hypothetical protein BN3087_660001 [Sulfurovum sp. enrichment culture clone C5]
MIIPPCLDGMLYCMTIQLKWMLKKKSTNYDKNNIVNVKIWVIIIT